MSMVCESIADTLAGRGANLTGTDFEGAILHRIMQRGYLEINKRDKARVADMVASRSWGQLSRLGDRWCSRQQYCGDKPDGKRLRTDFFLFDRVAFPQGLLIESKYQQVGGSVDEKLPWTVEFLSMQPSKAILIVDGGGAHEGMVKYVTLKSAQTANVTVHNFMSFYRLAL
ncbi:hypothetical protein CTA21_24515 [Salmonella enterica]|nr:hypothetical protein [Salmonella enterica]